MAADPHSDRFRNAGTDQIAHSASNMERPVKPRGITRGQFFALTKQAE